MPYTEWSKFIDDILTFFGGILCYLKSPLGTGLGIVLGNFVINIVKHWNYLKDISKVFDLIIDNQLDDISNIHIKCVQIKGRITTHYNTITSPKNSEKIITDPLSKDREIRGLLQDIQRIEYLVNNIKNDDLSKQKLSEVKSFKGEHLENIISYFRKLKVLIEDLRVFISHEFPSETKDVENFNWRSLDLYKKRIVFIETRINIAICLGLMAKKTFGSFDNRAKQMLQERFKAISMSESISDNKDYFDKDYKKIELFLKGIGSFEELKPG